MIREESAQVKEYPFILSKFRDYAQIMRPNVSLLVVFSSVIGYLLVPHISFVWSKVILLALGGMFVTNGANTINQIIERFSDRFMKRTSSRPMPRGSMGLTEAWTLVVLSTTIGILLLGVYFNWLAAGLSFLSLVIYGFIYTPLKKLHPIATFVGAIPGAFPPLIGWAAATNSLSGPWVVGGFVLFAIQLFWQFPHVWSIAWLQYDDYKEAGICLLPSRLGKVPFTGLQCIFYSLPLIPLGMVPYQIGLSGSVSRWICIAAGLVYVFNAFMFFKKNDKKTAKRLFINSLIYLPVVLLALVIDKV